MEIKLFGNSTILITSDNGKIIIDPYFSNKGNPMFKRSKPVCDDYNNIDKLDGILLTHSHFDHMDIGFINKFKGKCPLYAHKLSIKAAMLKSKGISVGDSFKIKDMVINVVKAIHPAFAVGYIIEVENKTIYISGDTFYGEFMKRIADNYKIDIVILPVTNYFPPMTMNKRSVLKAIDALKPEYFIPTHKDLVKRIRHIDCTVTKDEMSESLSRIKTKTKLIYLENGEVFTEVIENK